MKRTTTCALCTLCILIALGGCTTRRQAFPGHTPNQVCTAMQAAAESPEYDDWHLVTNEVWVDEEQSRIEVYREVRRTLHRPRAKPHNERRTWRLQLVLEQQDPPTVKFVSRGMSIPGHAREEADRFLIDVRRLLQSEYAAGVQNQPQPEEPAAHEQRQAVPTATVPEIDVDELDR